MEIIVPFRVLVSLYPSDQIPLSWLDPDKFSDEGFLLPQFYLLSYLIRFDLNNQNSLGFLEVAAQSHPLTRSFLFPTHFPFLIFSIPTPNHLAHGLCRFDVLQRGITPPTVIKLPANTDLTVVACLCLLRQSLPLVVL